MGSIKYTSFHWFLEKLFVFVIESPWHAFNQSYFQYVRTPVLHSTAQAHCRQQNAGLASISSEGEQAFLYKTFIATDSEGNCQEHSDWISILNNFRLNPIQIFNNPCSSSCMLIDKAGRTKFGEGRVSYRSSQMLASRRVREGGTGKFKELFSACILSAYFTMFCCKDQYVWLCRKNLISIYSCEESNDISIKFWCLSAYMY